MKNQQGTDSRFSQQFRRQLSQQANRVFLSMAVRVAVRVALQVTMAGFLSFAGCSAKEKSTDPNPDRFGQQNPTPTSTVTASPTPSMTVTPPAPTPTVGACTDPLMGVAGDLGVLVAGSAEFFNGETYFRFGAGGNVDLSGSMVGSRMPPDAARIDLAVGGRLSGKKIKVPNGQARAKEDSVVSKFESLGGLTKGSTLPFKDLAALAATVSTACSLPAKNGDVRIDCEIISGSRVCGLVLSGADPNVNVFQISATDIMNGYQGTPISSMLISFPPNAQAIVRITGNRFELANYRTILPSNITPLQLTWHFPEATDVTLIHADLVGGVFAPKAQITLDTVDLKGFVIGSSLKANSVWVFSP